MGRERKNLNGRLSACELRVDCLYERAGGSNDVALEACALLRIGAHDQERRDCCCGQKAGEDQIVEPETDRWARWLYRRRAHDVRKGLNGNRHYGRLKE